jgi:kinetochore protein Nuf2
MCEQLETEQIALKNTMLLTKDAQIKAVQDVEQYKTERNSLTKRKVWIYLESRYITGCSLQALGSSQWRDQSY